MACFSWGAVYPRGFEGRLCHDHATQIGIESSHAVEVAAGYRHSIVLMSDGTVHTTGVNNEGQLGRGGDPGKLQKVAGDLDMETVLHVAAGGLHSVAVAVSGQVYDWGLVFEEADHGGGDDSQHALPGMAQLDHRGEYLRRIVMRSAAAYLANRDVTEITYDAEASGDGRTRPTNASAAAAEAAEGPRPDTLDAQAVLRMRVQRVKVEVPRLVASLAGIKIKQVAAGYGHTIAIDVDGYMYSSGYNDRGQLGLGNRLASAAFKRINAPAMQITGTGAGAATAGRHRAVKVSCGQQHNVVVCDTGAVFVFGSNALHQLGLGRKSRDRLLPERVTGGDFMASAPAGSAGSGAPPFIVDVAAGANHCLVLSDEGVCYSWGHAEYQQMGRSAAAEGVHGGDLNLAAFYTYPREVEGLRPYHVVAVAAGGTFNLVLLSDATVISFGWDSFRVLGRGPAEERFGSSDFARVAGLQGRTVRSNHALAAVEPEGHAFAASWVSLLRSVNATATTEPAVPLPPEPASGRQTAYDRKQEAYLPPESFSAYSYTPSLSDSDAAVAADVSLIGSRPLDQISGAAAASRSAAQASVAPATSNYRSVLRESPAASGTSAAAVDAGPKKTDATSDMAATRRELSEAIAAMAARRRRKNEATGAAASVAHAGSVKAIASSLSGVVPRAGSSSAASSDSMVDEPEVRAHAVILAARCHVLWDLMQAARTSADGRAKLSTADITATFAPGSTSSKGSWQLHFAEQRRVVLNALATFLYSDALPHVPEHRLPALRALATTLDLKRLVVMCDRIRHAYDAEAPSRGRSGPAQQHNDAAELCKSTFVADLRGVERSSVLSDITVTAIGRPADSTSGQQRKFDLHQLILCRYDFFRKLLKNSFAEGNQAFTEGAATITLHDVDPDDFAAVADYLYTGDLSPLEADADVCMRTLACASRLCIQDLVSSGQDLIGERMTYEDVPVVVDYAETFALTRLLRYAKSLKAGDR